MLKVTQYFWSILSSYNDNQKCPRSFIWRTLWIAICLNIMTLYSLTWAKLNEQSLHCITSVAYIFYFEHYIKFSWTYWMWFNTAVLKQKNNKAQRIEYNLTSTLNVCQLSCTNIIDQNRHHWSKWRRLTGAESAKQNSQSLFIFHVLKDAFVFWDTSIGYRFISIRLVLVRSRLLYLCPTLFNYVVTL